MANEMGALFVGNAPNKNHIETGRAVDTGLNGS
jgi:hypothetical protein